MKKISLLIISIFFMGLYFFNRRTHFVFENDAEVKAEKAPHRKSKKKSDGPDQFLASAQKQADATSTSAPSLNSLPLAGLQNKKSHSAPKEKSSNHLVTYTIDAGVAVTQGDIILGEFEAGTLIQALSGQAPEPQIQTWPTNEIPYFIQVDLPNKERVIEALRMFSGTHVRFIPYENQEDAIIFERKEGVCKSYVGYIGGLQKIYLSDKCGPTEVAHEIMHSLGFVHEQNRFDRDQFIQVFWDNIEPPEKINFEKFSGSAMKASGSSSFDFESIMIYPEEMFSRNQSPTMKSVIDGFKIAPSDVLSPKDIERINRVY